jgi:hypothetical protein
MPKALILDLETAPLPNAADYLDPVTPAKNLKDPIKIAADIEERERKQREDCGLDWNLNRIVCVGLWGTDTEPTVLIARDETDERDILLDEVASHLSPMRHTLIGFCIRRFDVPTLLARARYLNVKLPWISLKRWDNPHVTDLYDVLTFDDQPCTSVMKRSLPSFCRRFGIHVDDTHSGADVAALVEAGDWDAVASHCRADLQRTALLAARLGYIPQPSLAEATTCDPF